ncbi:MAG: hypothetical protein ACRYGG_11120 [Janthinobacterium lividum]
MIRCEIHRENHRGGTAAAFDDEREAARITCCHVVLEIGIIDDKVLGYPDFLRHIKSLLVGGKAKVDRQLTWCFQEAAFR